MKIQKTQDPTVSCQKYIDRCFKSEGDKAVEFKRREIRRRCPHANSWHCSSAWGTNCWCWRVVLPVTFDVRLVNLKLTPRAVLWILRDNLRTAPHLWDAGDAEVGGDHDGGSISIHPRTDLWRSILGGCQLLRLSQRELKAYPRTNGNVYLGTS